MENWIEKPLNYWGDFKKGGLFSKADIDLSGNNFCIHYGELFTKYNEVIYDVISKTNKKNGIISKSGDILFPASDVTPFGLGKASTILKENVVLGGDMHIFSPNKDVDSVFLSYQINLFKNEIIRLVTGSAVKHSKSKDIGLMPTLVPLSIIEQQKIAKILTTLDNTIKKTEQLITKYKNIKQGLMHDLLNYGIDENGTIRNPQTHTFVEKKGLVVPEEWEVEQLDEIAYVSGGKRLPAGHEYSYVNFGFKYLRVTDFYNKKIDYFSLENLEERTFRELENYEIFPNDLFFSIAGSIGYVGVNKPDIEDRIILTENALRINVTKVVLPDFLSLQINSEVVQKQIWSEVGTGGGVPKLAKHRVESLLIPLPKSNGNYNEQEKIISILEKHDKLIESEQTNLAKLQNLKQGLMADLLTGKVRVELKEIHNYV